MALNEQTAIGSILPDVNIKKMVINDTNDYHLIQRYPHIVHPSEDMPSPGSNGMSVTLTLNIRDTISNAYKEYLFNSLELEKYLMIRVYQFSDAKDNNNQPLSAAKMKSSLNNQPTSAKQIVLANAYAAMPGTTIRDIKVLDSAQGANTFKLAPADGRYFDIPFEVSMESLNGRPENLFFIVQTVLDHEAIADDYDIKSGYLGSIKNLAGNLNFGIVYENGSIKKTTNIFYTPSGKVWTGPMHYHQTSGHMAGPTHKDEITSEDVPANQAHFPLIKSTIKNLKIQDMRMTSQVDSFLPSFLYDFNKNLEDPLLIKMLSQNPAKSINYDSANEALDSNGFVSDPLITHDMASNPRIFFTLDMLQIARDNFKYGKLLSRTQADGPLSTIKFESNIFKNDFIKKIQIVRQEVRNGKVDVSSEEIIATANRAENGTLLSNFDKFISDSEEMVGTKPLKALNREKLKELIFFGEKKQKFQNFQYPGLPYFNSLAGDKGALVDVTKQLRLHGSSKKLRSFMFTDLTAKNSPEAYFSYKVKLVLNDGTIDAVKELLTEAQNKRVFLEEYFNIITAPGMYDAERKSVTQAFNEVYGGVPIAMAIVGGTFKQMIRFLAAAMPDANTSLFSDSIFDALLAYIMPVSATPESVRSFLEFYDKIYNTIAAATKMKNASRNAAIDTQTPTSKVSTAHGAKDFIELNIRLKNAAGSSLTYASPQQSTHLFRQPHNKNILFDFFGFDASRQTVGLHKNATLEKGLDRLKYLKSISPDDLTARYEQEIDTFFKENIEYALQKQNITPDIKDYASILKYSPKGTYAGAPAQGDSKFYLTPKYIGSRAEGLALKGGDNYALALKSASLSSGASETAVLIRKSLLIQMLANASIGAGMLDLHFPVPFEDFTGDDALDVVSARKNLSYLTSKVAVALGINPSPSVLNTDAAQSNVSLTLVNPLWPDHEDFKKNVEGQFINEEEHSTTPDNVTNKVPLLEAARVDALAYIVLCHLMQKFFSNKPAPVYNLDSPQNALTKGVAHAIAGTPLPGKSNNKFDQANMQLEDLTTPVKKLLVDQYWKSLPLQIKYLIYGHSSFVQNSASEDSSLLETLFADGQTPLDHNNVCDFLLMTSIYKVQYLAGYANSITDNTFSLKEPVFEDVTPATRLQLAGKSLVCRLERYVNPDYCYNLENVLNITIADRYFMLDLPTLDGTSASSQNEEPQQDAAIATGNDQGTSGNDNAAPENEEAIEPTTGGYTD